RTDLPGRPSFWLHEWHRMRRSVLDREASGVEKSQIPLSPAATPRAAARAGRAGGPGRAFSTSSGTGQAALQAGTLARSPAVIEEDLFRARGAIAAAGSRPRRANGARQPGSPARGRSGRA